MSLKGVLTPDQLAKKIGVSIEMVLSWRDQGMPSVKIGKSIFVLEKSLVEWLKTLESPKVPNR
jgi:hypothetical protein